MNSTRQSSYKYKKFCLAFLMSLLIFSFPGCSDSAFSVSNQSGGYLTYPISSEVFTTRQRAIVPDSVTSFPNTILPWESSKFKQNGYGAWHYVSGIDYGKDPSIMPTGYNSASVTNTALLLSFFTIADTHVYDKESPSQPFYLLIKDIEATLNGIPGITFTMLYTTHILDAAIQTVNAPSQTKAL